jgi:trk system potassium uptake protein TrkH
MLMVQKHIGLGESLLLQDAFNLNSLSGLARFVRRVVLGTLVVEGVGALLYMAVFIPQFGLRGIWISVFNAVSAFCNAGIDIIGETSLSAYVGHPLVNGVTCGLIILGSMGFPV